MHLFARTNSGRRNSRRRRNARHADRVVFPRCESEIGRVFSAFRILIRKSNPDLQSSGDSVSSRWPGRLTMAIRVRDLRRINATNMLIDPGAQRDISRSSDKLGDLFDLSEGSFARDLIIMDKHTSRWILIVSNEQFAASQTRESVSLTLRSLSFVSSSALFLLQH
jgi:hypothetical protein